MWTGIRNVDAFDQVTYCEPTLNYHALKSNTTVVLRHVRRVSRPLCCDVSLTVCAKCLYCIKDKNKNEERCSMSFRAGTDTS